MGLKGVSFAVSVGFLIPTHKYSETRRH